MHALPILIIIPIIVQPNPSNPAPDEPVTDSKGPEAARWFSATQWTDVLQAKYPQDSAMAETALARLCENYWTPIYSYLRRFGYSKAEAEDLTQGFFEHLIGRDWLKNVEPGQGKFRSFLLKSLKNFSLNVRAKERAEKRGGKEMFVALNDIDLDERQISRGAESLTPEEAFDRTWAQSLMQRAVDRLREEYIKSGKGELYEALKGLEYGERGASSYAQIGARLQMSEAGVKTAVHRMRARLASILQSEILATLANPHELEEEMRYLRQALSRSGNL